MPTQNVVGSQSVKNILFEINRYEDPQYWVNNVKQIICKLPPLFNDYSSKNIMK